METPTGTAVRFRVDPRASQSTVQASAIGTGEVCCQPRL